MITVSGDVSVGGVPPPPMVHGDLD